jgi:hypothetical protein
MHQVWHDLLFAHWPVPVEALRPHIPIRLPIDTFDGAAWIGIVPFRMSDVRPRGLPSLPWLSAFPELNVRTYVTLDDRPGVWFFSLDAANPVAVRIARRFFKLPYMDAQMSVIPDPIPNPSPVGGGEICYRSHRTHRGEPPADFVARYWPCGETFTARPDSLEYFLTARYCLYTADAQGCIYRAEIDHPAWPLQLAEAEITTNTMTRQIDLKLPDERPLLHFSRKLKMVAWPLQQV